MVFSAKESAFKAQFLLTGEMLEFCDLEIRFTPDQGRFFAKFLRGVTGYDAGQVIGGRIALGADYVLSAVEIPANC